MTSPVRFKTIAHHPFWVEGGNSVLSEPADPCSQAKSLLRWWCQHQARLLIEEADTLRNGVLQDVFALRRHLELVNQQGIHDHGNSYESCLQEVEHIYKSLQSLSDRISSPYVEESLPLSLQHFLHPWQAALTLHIELTNSWDIEPIEHIAVLIALLHHILQTVTAAPETPLQLAVVLQRQPTAKTLTLKLTHPNTLPPPLTSLSQSEDMISLLKTFQWLSSGTFHVEPTAQALTWKLTW